MKKSKGKAFTLAEVLITLAIIGVVSAIVIPTVIKDYNDKKYNTARLKALKTFGEAGKLASINGEINGQPSARAFVENVLSKYLKITKVCDTAEECGFPATFKASNFSVERISDNYRNWSNIGSNTYNNWTPINDNSMTTYILTIDGYSAKLFYNPNCARKVGEIMLEPCGNDARTCRFWNTDAACMNVIYDMNGLKGPNHVGEDIGFVTTFWSGLNAISIAPGIAPYNINGSALGNNFSNATNYCSNMGTNKIQYSLPNIDELLSLILNKTFSSMPAGDYWSSTPVLGRQNVVWAMYIAGYRWQGPIQGGYIPWCVRR